MCGYVALYAGLSVAQQINVNTAAIDIERKNRVVRKSALSPRRVV